MRESPRTARVLWQWISAIGSCMVFGSVRVSQGEEQETRMPETALRTAGVDQLFTERASGGHRDCPQLHWVQISAMRHPSMPRIALLTAIPRQINRDLVDQQEALGGPLMVPAFNDTVPRVLRMRVTNQIDGIRDAVAYS
jgi:hypothetical protein